MKSSFTFGRACCRALGVGLVAWLVACGTLYAGDDPATGKGKGKNRPLKGVKFFGATIGGGYNALQVGRYGFRGGYGMVGLVFNPKRRFVYVTVTPTFRAYMEPEGRQAKWEYGHMRLRQEELPVMLTVGTNPRHKVAFQFSSGVGVGLQQVSQPEYRQAGSTQAFTPDPIMKVKPWYAYVPLMVSVVDGHFRISGFANVGVTQFLEGNVPPAEMQQAGMYGRPVTFGAGLTYKLNGTWTRKADGIND